MRSVVCGGVYLFAVLGIAAMLGGCVYKGGKITEGVDFSAGVSLPGTDGVAEISFVNYLSGFRFGIDRNAAMECEYYGTNNFSFAWGLYESQASKHFTATVSPCEVAPTNEPFAKLEMKYGEPPHGNATIIATNGEWQVVFPKEGCGKAGCKCVNCTCGPSSCPCTDDGGVGTCGCPARTENPL